MSLIILIAQIVFILSLLGIAFIIVKKIPALSRLPEEPLIERRSFKMIVQWPANTIKRLIAGSFFQNILVADLEKSLRKFKIAALKIYNVVDKFIEKLKGKSGNGMPS